MGCGMYISQFTLLKQSFVCKERHFPAGIFIVLCGGSFRSERDAEVNGLSFKLAWPMLIRCILKGLNTLGRFDVCGPSSLLYMFYIHLGVLLCIGLFPRVPRVFSEPFFQIYISLHFSYACSYESKRRSRFSTTNP